MEPQNTEESFLTVAEVAELLKLNQQTVRNWIDAGSLPALKVGRRVRIRRSDLERKLEEGRTTAAPPTRSAGPSAQDFWSGATIGVAEIDPSREDSGTIDYFGVDRSADPGHPTAGPDQAGEQPGHAADVEQPAASDR
jgi:excisionase family DNA binding protein